jgi:hypothetical protein
MSDRPGYGESWTCANCHKAILGEGPWGINPDAICRCASPRRVDPFVSPFGNLFADRRLYDAASEAQSLLAEIRDAAPEIGKRFRRVEECYVALSDALNAIPKTPAQTRKPE